MMIQGINVNYLESYERMGKVLFECISGCTCTATIISGYKAERRISQTQAKCILVTQSPDCLIRMTVQKV